MVNAESPWRSCKTERHGGLLKDVLQKASEDGIAVDAPSLDALLAEAALTKNQRVSRGGFSFVVGVWEGA